MTRSHSGSRSSGLVAMATRAPGVSSWIVRLSSISRSGSMETRTTSKIAWAISREQTEPIDPVAGHIPGAVNRPWQAVTRPDGVVRDPDSLREQWGDLLDTPELVVYCGSGVTACVNLFSLALLGREDATLYAGSWSDWCSHL